MSARARVAILLVAFLVLSAVGPLAQANPLKPPTSPRGLTAQVGPGAGEISLAWREPANSGSGPVLGYNVYRDGPDGRSERIAELGDVRSFVDARALIGALMKYRVAARNLAGESGPSNTVQATAVALPGAPENLEATAGPGRGQIALAWQPPADDGGSAVMGYRIFRGPSADDLTFLTQVGNVVGHVDGPLADAATFFYAVSALTLAGQGPQSVPASATTFDLPSPPVGLAARALDSPGRIHLTWSPPESDGGARVEGYRIHRADTQGEETFHREVGGDLTEYTDEVASGGTMFYFLTARTAAGESPASNGASATAASGDTVTTMESTLPTGRYGLGAVWTGTHAFVFGGASAGSSGASLSAQQGSGQLYSDILRYDAEADELVPMQATLPEGICCGPAVFHQGHAYILGGLTADGICCSAASLSSAEHGDGICCSDTILRYDVANDEIAIMQATLLDGICCGPAVSDGQFLWIFGGRVPDAGASTATAGAEGGWSNLILRYDPANDEVVAIGQTLPEGICCSMAVFDGTHVYLFGGETATGFASGVLRFDPQTHEIVEMGAVLPEGICCGTSVWSGEYAYLFGGETAEGMSGTILRYDPAGDRFDVMPATLPEGICCNAAVWTGSNAFLFGGATQETATDVILRYNVAPGAPQNVVALPGPGVGDVRILWDPPATEGSQPVDGYRLYRGLESGRAELLAEVGLVTEYVDTTCPAVSLCFYQVSAFSTVGEGARSDEAFMLGTQVEETSAASAARPSPPSRAVGPILGGPT
ncbi:MAG TPA: fibronectin type III domain-containing protein [Candidatus Thermoplasmatota archaeon]|nr:fibronectin type III domain-containing protein [Candidatus Thermoplasmatota archaeon]